MPLKKFLSRIFNTSKDIEFQVLKSSSAVELHYFNKNAARAAKQRFIPRYYSHHDDLTIVQARRAEPETELKIVSKDDQDMTKSAEDLCLVFIHVDEPKFPTPLAHIPEDLLGDQQEQEGYNALLKDPNLDSALATCHLFRQHPDFQEGILLKCVEPKSQFPYLHYGVFHNRSDGKRLQARHLTRLNRNMSPNPGARPTQGVYEELYSIVKKTSSFESRLPTSKYTGFIVIGFKILQPDTQDSLEKSWLTWTGAREITKYTPRVWNLKRITLHKCRNINPAPNFKHQHDGFAYILFCEFANIMQPQNFLPGCEVVERLKARNCGHVGFYKVHWTYSKSSPNNHSLPKTTSFDGVLDENCQKPEHHKLTHSASAESPGFSSASTTLAAQNGHGRFEDLF